MLDKRGFAVKPKDWSQKAAEVGSSALGEGRFNRAPQNWGLGGGCRKGSIDNSFFANQMSFWGGGGGGGAVGGLARGLCRPPLPQLKARPPLQWGGICSGN